MRIVHISDIHLSEENFATFEDDYREALLKILLIEHKKKKIDIIAITGDLVDRGGHSLFKLEQFKDFKDPYEIFEKEFINPIKEHLGLQNSNFLFIPGNHDIDENDIKWIHEKELKKIEAAGKLNRILPEIRLEVKENYNHRIKKFKDFEKKFHKDSIGTNYVFTRNQSTFVYQYSKNIKVGFALINDSWRCSTCDLVAYQNEGLYFGYKQLNEALNSLIGTTMNIVLTHHPIESFAEKEDVSNILKGKDYHLHLFGDKHHHQVHQLVSSVGSCFGLMARSALNKPAESESKWQPGFHIIDINFYHPSLEYITYYRYWSNSFHFGYDTEIAPPTGIDDSNHTLRFDPAIMEANIATLSTNLDNLERQNFEAQ